MFSKLDIVNSIGHHTLKFLLYSVPGFTLRIIEGFHNI
jgi:hypothetical protein